MHSIHDPVRCTRDTTNTNYHLNRKLIFLTLCWRRKATVVAFLFLFFLEASCPYLSSKSEMIFHRSTIHLLYFHINRGQKSSIKKWRFNSRLYKGKFEYKCGLSMPYAPVCHFVFNSFHLPIETSYLVLLGSSGLGLL